MLCPTLGAWSDGVIPTVHLKPKTTCTCRLACVDMSAAKPGEELAAILTCGAHFVQDRWAAACTKLNAIPRQLPRNLHSSGASYPSMPTRRMDAPSRCSAAPSETVVQIALHTPDNNFSRSHLILASASHTLSQVKDAIRCVNVQHAEDVLGSVLTGGYMFIESTLYVDDRDPGACKYHEPILKFLKEQATQVGQAVWKYLHANGLAIAQPEDSAVPPVRSMSTTRLCDLKMLPGQLSQYVFAHAGACEHMMLIEDIRLNHATDPSLEQGPVVTRAVPETLLKCCICMLRPGVKFACDDNLAPTSPAVFCEKCFHELHYASDGHPVTDQIGMDVFGVHVR